MLFGINNLLNRAAILAQTGVVGPEVMVSLDRCKERLLREIRPEAVTLVDGIGLPDSAVRSLIVSGNIYEVRIGIFRICSMRRERVT